MGRYTFDSTTQDAKKTLALNAPRTVGKVHVPAPGVTAGTEADGDSGSGKSVEAPLFGGVYGIGNSQDLRQSVSESEVGTPGRGAEASQWNKTRTRRVSGSSGSKSPSETDCEQSNNAVKNTRQANGLVHKDLVKNLKAQARRHESRTSLYRGVSLLRQTGKFHAQINVQRKQLHLGFFFSEEEAARAYDRAAIFKASVEGGAICTNMDISEYKDEIPMLQSLTQPELLALLHEMKVKSNESSAPSSPRKSLKVKTSANTKSFARNDQHNSGVEHVRVKMPCEPPSSPRFDALSNAAVVAEDRELMGVAKVAVTAVASIPRPRVIDLHVSKRRRTRLLPRQAPAAA
tara:strand:- start:820 stop:1857 length:1038 start_codon:yes stop_codon:yes gene_type:complete